MPKPTQRKRRRKHRWTTPSITQVRKALAEYSESGTSDYPELERWVKRYCEDAPILGDLSLDYGLLDGIDPDLSALSAIRLVADLYPFNEEPEWLDTQAFDGPSSKGEWLRLDFEDPYQWLNAKLFIENLWTYAFSQLVIAARSRSVHFDLSFNDGRRVSQRRARDWRNAVIDGMNWDFDESQYELSVIHEKARLGVHITR